jgi:hypothetical protein
MAAFETVPWRDVTAIVTVTIALILFIEGWLGLLFYLLRKSDDRRREVQERAHRERIRAIEWGQVDAVDRERHRSTVLRMSFLLALCMGAVVPIAALSYGHLTLKQRGMDARDRGLTWLATAAVCGMGVIAGMSVMIRGARAVLEPPAGQASARRAPPATTAAGAGAAPDAFSGTPAAYRPDDAAGTLAPAGR